jgi:hypothetical protein
MKMQGCLTMKNAPGLIGFMLLSVLLFQARASITNLSVASGKNYQVAILQIGAAQYIDRNFTFTNIDSFANREYIQTANNDKNSTASNFIIFTLTRPGLVCIAHDDRITQKPSWLSQFTLTDKDLVTTDGHPFSVYTKHFEVGTIVLGGNLAVSSGSFVSMYSVVVVDQVRPTISDIRVANGRAYTISTVAKGEKQYVDRDYVLTDVGSLEGHRFIQAFNNDKFTVSDSFLSFTLDMPAVIYVAHDDRITAKPDWLLDFMDTDIDIMNSEGHHPMSVFQKVVPAGRVTLGGNAQTTPPDKFISMYTVIAGDVASFVYTFSKTYEGDAGSTVQQTTDGGYIIGGYSSKEERASYAKAYLIRTNSLGDTLWRRLHSNYPDESYINDVKKTSDGGYAATGFFNGNLLLLKVDSSGNEIWRKLFSTQNVNIGYSVQQTFDEGYIICGTAYTYEDGEYKTYMYLTKTDGNGEVIWTKTFGKDIWGSTGLQTNDSGFVFTGSTILVPGGRSDIYVVKTDQNGDTVWTRTYGSAATSDGGSCIQKTTDGNYIVACQGWDAELALLKIDKTGNELWHSILSDRDTIQSQLVIPTSDGGYAAMSGPNITIYKTDANGDILWTKEYSGEGQAMGGGIQQTLDGGYVVSGSTGPVGHWADKVLLLKTDANGNINQ